MLADFETMARLRIEAEQRELTTSTHRRQRSGPNSGGTTCASRGIVRLAGAPLRTAHGHLSGDLGNHDERSDDDDDEPTRRAPTSADRTARRAIG